MPSAFSTYSLASGDFAQLNMSIPRTSSCLRLERKIVPSLFKRASVEADCESADVKSSSMIWRLTAKTSAMMLTLGESRGVQIEFSQIKAFLQLQASKHCTFVVVSWGCHFLILSVFEARFSGLPEEKSD